MSSTRLIRRERSALPGDASVAFRWPLTLVALVVPILIAAATPEKHLGGALLAYTNIVVFLIVAVYFIRQRTLQGLIPVIYLAWLIAAWPLASIYFAIECPTYSYTTMAEEREFLYGDDWLQLVTLAFLVSYLTTFAVFRGRHAPWSVGNGELKTDQRVVSIILWIVISAITVHAVSKLLPLPDLLQYIANGSYLYLHGLMLMVGVLFLRLPLQTRWRAIVFMAIVAGFYTLGNARGQAAAPTALFLLGLIFLSNLDHRWKVWIVTIGCLCFPLALVFSNTTRLVTGTIGFQDLASRVKALEQWQQVLSSTPILASTFGRLFFVGGHTIVTMSPERFPYIDFSWSSYIWELLTRMMPRKAVFESYYSANPNLILGQYDFLITEDTSVAVSLIGSLYMLGGIIAVMIGGVGIGLLHSGLARLIGNLAARSKYLALFVFAMISSNLLWGQNIDPITHLRGLVWAGTSAVIIYQLMIRPFVGASAPLRRRFRRVRRLVPHVA